MIHPPTPPSAGKPVSAGFFSRLVSWMKSCMLIEGPGYRLGRGPNGTVLHIDVKAVAKAVKPIPGCFDISKKEVSADGSGCDFSFANRYYWVGGRFYELDGESVSVDSQTIVALEITFEGFSPTASLGTHTSLSDINQQVAQSGSYIVIPLYELLPNGSVLCDFRNMPMGVAWEFQ